MFLLYGCPAFILHLDPVPICIEVCYITLTSMLAKVSGHISGSHLLDIGSLSE